MCSRVPITGRKLNRIRENIYIANGILRLDARQRDFPDVAREKPGKMWHRLSRSSRKPQSRPYEKKTNVDNRERTPGFLLLKNGWLLNESSDVKKLKSDKWEGRLSHFDEWKGRKSQKHKWKSVSRRRSSLLPVPLHHSVELVEGGTREIDHSSENAARQGFSEKVRQNRGFAVERKHLGFSHER